MWRFISGFYQIPFDGCRPGFLLSVTYSSKIQKRTHSSQWNSLRLFKRLKWDPNLPTWNDLYNMLLSEKWVYKRICLCCRILYYKCVCAEKSRGVFQNVTLWVVEFGVIFLLFFFFFFGLISFLSFCTVHLFCEKKGNIFWKTPPHLSWAHSLAGQLDVNTPPICSLGRADCGHRGLYPGVYLFPEVLVGVPQAGRELWGVPTFEQHVWYASCQEYRSEKSLEELTKLVPPECNWWVSGILGLFGSSEDEEFGIICTPHSFI